MRGLYFHLVHGMVEYWNVDFERKFIIYILHVNLNFPIYHHPIFPKPNIPSFQYSNIPIGAKPLSSTSFWGQAPKIIFY